MVHHWDRCSRGPLSTVSLQDVNNLLINLRVNTCSVLSLKCHGAWNRYSITYCLLESLAVAKLWQFFVAYRTSRCIFTSTCLTIPLPKAPEQSLNFVIVHPPGDTEKTNLADIDPFLYAGCQKRGPGGRGWLQVTFSGISLSVTQVGWWTLSPLGEIPALSVALFGWVTAPRSSRETRPGLCWQNSQKLWWYYTAQRCLSYSLSTLWFAVLLLHT